MGVQLDAVTQAHVDRAVDDLCHEFTGIFSRETVARFVTESIHSLGGARFADFVPVLAYRFARERLQALGQTEGAIADELEARVVRLLGELSAESAFTTSSPDLHPPSAHAG